MEEYQIRAITALVCYKEIGLPVELAQTIGQSMYCFCQDLVGKMYLTCYDGSDCQAPNHTCICVDICSYDEYREGYDHCGLVCQAPEGCHGCICIYDTEKPCASSAHDCICEPSILSPHAHLCKHEGQHDCTCNSSTDICKSVGNHNCTCGVDINKCRGTKHLCTCESGNPNSCLAVIHSCTCYKTVYCRLCMDDDDE